MARSACGVGNLDDLEHRALCLACQRAHDGYYPDLLLLGLLPVVLLCGVLVAALR